ARLGILRAIIGPASEDGRGGPLPKPDAVCLRTSMLALVEVVGELRVKARLLRRVERNQRIMRRLGNGGVHRGVGRGGGKAGITLVAASDGIHHLEDRDMDDRHGPAGARGTVLLAKDPVLSPRYGRVIDPTGVEGHLVPMPELVHRLIPVAHALWA